MYKRILVPLDGSHTSLCGLKEALLLAAESRAKVCALHVVEPVRHVTGFEPFVVYWNELLPQLRKAGADLLDDAQRRADQLGVDMDVAMLETLVSSIADLIVDRACSWHADLIVIGTHGRRGVHRFVFGSDAEQLLRISPVPVLLVHSK